MPRASSSHYSIPELPRVLIFARTAILLFSGPKLEVLLFLSAFYAGRDVFTAFLKAIRRFFLLFLCFRLFFDPKLEPK